MKRKAWKQKAWHFKNRIEIEEYKDGRYGARGMKREKKKKATPEQIQKQNRSNKVKSIKRYILANFSPGDYWITLTCSREYRPSGIQEAIDQRKRFLDKLRTGWRKAGFELKWMAITERGSKGGVHHHLIINRIPDGDQLIKRAWPYGKAWMELLYEDGGYKDLAEYMVKQTEEAAEARYSHSRNLIKPVAKEKYFAKFPKIKPVEGYIVEEVVEGINPVTGYPYRHYSLVKVKKRE